MENLRDFLENWYVFISIIIKIVQKEEETKSQSIKLSKPKLKYILFH